jgi:S-adenosylmethionine-dependent methyltransferase
MPTPAPRRKQLTSRKLWHASPGSSGWWTPAAAFRRGGCRQARHTVRADMSRRSPWPSARWRRHQEAGRRTAAVWATVVRRLLPSAPPSSARPLRVLDLGGGTGGTAVPLAEAGHEVIVVDPSLDALASLRRRAAEAGLSDTLVSTQGDADDLRAILKARVDLVCLHGTLEVVDDPGAHRGPHRRGGHPRWSPVPRHGPALAAVIARALAGQFQSAQRSSTTPTGGGAPAIRSGAASINVEPRSCCFTHAGFMWSDSHGVRLFSDLVPPAIDSEPDRAALIASSKRSRRTSSSPALGQIGASPARGRPPPLRR